MMKALAAWLVVLSVSSSAMAQSAVNGTANAREELESLSRTLRKTPRLEAVLQSLPALGAAMRDKDLAAEAVPVMEQAIDALLPNAADNDTWRIATPLLKFVARNHFEQADPAKAEQRLKQLRELHRAIAGKSGDADAPWQLARGLNQVAAEYLRGGQMDAALAVAGEAVDLGLPLREDYDDGRAMLAGALHRGLEQFTPDERYKLLHDWMMPTAERRAVRELASPASTEAPPASFARALGERPSARAFPIPEIAGIPGLFSSSWLLVTSAADSGQLRILTSELTDAAKQGVPNADYVLRLARIVGFEPGRDDLLLSELQAVSERLRAPAKPNEPAMTPAFSLHDMAIACACLTHEALRAAGEDMLLAGIEQTYGRNSELLRPLLRRVHAAAVQKRFAEANVADNSNLPLWLSAGSGTAAQAGRGAAQQIWLGHEDQILHLAGARNDYLCFRYPLVGDFEFQCEAQDGGGSGTEGNIAFGGLAYEANGANNVFRVANLDVGQAIERPFHFMRRERWATFQRLSLKSSADGARLAINGHPVWHDLSPQSNSPWLALGSSGDRTPVFRGFKLTGNPTIPREVRLSDGNRMRGWFARYYSGNIATEPDVIERYAADTPLDWYLKDGVIHGSSNGRDLTTATQSRLAYFRPLEDQEIISYEFFYEPGRYAVHPALGRLAFLIEPGGVGLHWMTTEESEWTGLAEDNVVVEPLNRRGPRVPPLKAGDWNQVSVALAKETATLTLNGTLIYSRKLERDNPRTFSLFHDRNRSAVQVRNVVLRGAWPERLSETQLANLAAPSESDRSTSDRQLLGELFAERHVPDSALHVHRRAAAMSVEQRFNFLSNWVLPGVDHRALRLALDYTPTDPAPPAADVDPIDAQRMKQAAGQRFVPTGGNLVAPVLDLIEAARELGRLDQVRQQVDRIQPTDDYTRRARLAMLVLIDIAREEFPPAVEGLLQLYPLVEAGTHTLFEDRWPETLAIAGALRHEPTREVAREMAFHLYFRQARSGPASGSEAWRRQMLALGGLAKLYQSQPKLDIGHFTTPPKLQQWRPMPRTTAKSRGAGYPRQHVQLVDGRIDCFATHDIDTFYFQSPLRGDYEIEFDVPAFGYRDTNALVAGLWVAARYDLKSYSFGDFRGLKARGAIDPPLSKNGRLLHYRVVVRNGASTTYVNGRQIYEQALEENYDPWLAIKLDNAESSVENIRITGNPQIPAELHLSTSNNLDGWYAHVDYEKVTGQYSAWRPIGDLANGGHIVGGLRRDAAGTFMESLLRYHRPMLEDGTIEYDFYYRPGTVDCHPALDRLAFLLEPAGVRIHWITDGIHDRTQLDADNATVEPQSQLGPLPLVAETWNRLALTLQGDTVTLVLNGQPIYRRELEPTNQRVFGLFHYSDQSESQVRNVVWRGDWPRVLPPVSEQELAGKQVIELDRRLPELTAVFQHDFVKGGFPSNLFSVTEGDPYNHFAPQPDGLHVNREGKPGYHNAAFAPRLSIHGDFDITAEYAQLQTTMPAKDGACSLILQGRLDNAAAHEFMIYRRRAWRANGPPEESFQTATKRRDNGEYRQAFSANEAFEATSGRLRLARRGEMVYLLLAEGDSPNFRLVRTEKVDAGDIGPDGLRMIAQVREPGRIGVVWKSLVVRAEDLTGLALEDPRAIVSQLDQERERLPARYQHDFIRHPFTNAGWLRWGFQPPATLSGQGLLVRHPGVDHWASAGASPHVSFGGDFDISFEFDGMNADVPKPGQYSSVYLQMEFPTESKLQASVIHGKRENGQTYMTAQVRLPNANGTFNYPNLRQELAADVRRMRFARRGNTLYFLYFNGSSQTDQLLARYDVPDTEVPDGLLRMLVHTGGVGRVAESAWKKLSIQAETIAGPAVLPPVRQ